MDTADAVGEDALDAAISADEEEEDEAGQVIAVCADARLLAGFESTSALTNAVFVTVTGTQDEAVCAVKILASKCRKKERNPVA